MNTLDFLSSLFGQLWFLLLVVLLLGLLKSAKLKGMLGEYIVNRALSELPNPEYTLVKNVTLPTEDGTTHIDHILVSKYGVFVIETKNMKGWIFGSVKQRYWTQKIFRHTFKFQNPLHQNYKHIRVLESLLTLPSDHFHSVIVFVGENRFKTSLPDNVLKVNGCVNYVRGFDDVILTQAQCNQVLKKLSEVRHKPGVMTDIKHQRHVKTVVMNKQSVKRCNRCGSEMVLREARRGHHIGQSFWACSTFPKCRSVEQCS